MKILLVEQYDVHRFCVISQLKKEQHEVTLALLDWYSTKGEDIKYFKDLDELEGLVSEHDASILDFYTFFKMSGEIKYLQPLAGKDVIVTSTGGANDFLDKFGDQAFHQYHYLPKPFDKRKLLEAIAKASSEA